MNKHQSMVMEFHDKFGCTVGNYPDIRDRELAAKLILEEAVETCAAFGYGVTAAMFEQDHDEAFRWDESHKVAEFEKLYRKPDFVEIIDGLSDLDYVLNGAGVRLGVDLDPFFEEVHRSNMAKEGGLTRGDGKILKPEGWQPPDIDTILIRQQNAADMWMELEQAALDDNDSPIEVINAAESAA